MSTEKPLVLVIGGTGNTGLVILKALAETGAWRLAASVRPTSLDKPQVSVLRNLGVEIRVSDWQNDSVTKLDELFFGVDTLISTVTPRAIPEQKILVDAAKRANAKRFIPCDFGTACIPGVREMYDEKLKVRSYVRDSKVPYTFIDVGFWMQLTVPYREADKGFVASMVRDFYGDGNQKTAVVNVSNIGKFVARIISDHRTLNQYVFIYDEALTMNEIYEIASKAAGENFHKIKVAVSEDDILARIATAKAEIQTTPSPYSHQIFHGSQYAHSIYIAGHNTVEVAKSQGALDGKELYPDLGFQSVAEYAKEFYSGETQELVGY